MLFDDQPIIGLFWCPHCQKDVVGDDLRKNGLVISSSIITMRLKHSVCQQTFDFIFDVKGCFTEKEGVHIDMQNREIGDHLK